MYTRIHILVTAVVGAVTGAAAGYIFAQRRLETKYATQYENELAAFKTYTAMIKKEDEFSSPVTAAAVLGVVPDNINTETAAEKLIQSLGYRGDKTPPTVIVRDTTRPYLLRKDEFLDNESGLEQTTLTYFKGDDILCDEADNIVEDVDRVVGKANLDRFGELSEDDNVVYVRNEKLRVEYEIMLDQREYAEVVAGLKE